MIKRIVLFGITNLLVLASLSAVVSLLGLWPVLGKSGLDYTSLALFCLIWGGGGAFISLLLSRISAKMMMGVRLVQADSPGVEGWLARTVHELAFKAGLPAPEVGIYDSPEVNAFATGPSKARSLVAVSSGLLSSMSREEAIGVLGHEVAHIKNGDMVTMTLIQGVVNAFTMFIARIVAFLLTQHMREEERAGTMGIITFVLDMALGMLGFLVVCWFSRQREFRADRGSASIIGSKQPMIAALRALGVQGEVHTSQEADAHAALKISGGVGRFGRLFSTHPPLEERIQALVEAQGAALASAGALSRFGA